MTLPDDPVLQELLPEFLASWQRDLRMLLPTFVADRNREELYRFGHTLKGSARQFGFEHLAALGAEIMEAAQQQRWDIVSQIASAALAELTAIEESARQCGILPPQGSTNLE